MAKGIFMGEGNRFYWNVDANVGPGCPNKTEDVQFVQLAYACAAVNPKNLASPDLKAIYANVKPGAMYTGSPSDPLSIAIKAHQKSRGGAQDGVVSTMKNATGLYGPWAPWMLIGLNNNVSDVLGSSWPRVSQHKNCPSALRDAEDRVFLIR